MLIPLLAALLLGTAACSDDSDDAASTPTPTPAATSAPATPATPDADTAEPDLSSLDAAGAAAIAQARESYVASCVANTPELDQENCALVRNCAVNQVGVAVAADPAQAAKLDEALATCEASLL